MAKKSRSDKASTGKSSKKALKKSKSSSKRSPKESSSKKSSCKNAAQDTSNAPSHVSRTSKSHKDSSNSHSQPHVITNSSKKSRGKSAKTKRTSKKALKERQKQMAALREELDAARDWPPHEYLTDVVMMKNLTQLLFLEADTNANGRVDKREAKTFLHSNAFFTTYFGQRESNSEASASASASRRNALTSGTPSPFEDVDFEDLFFKLDTSKDGFLDLSEFQLLVTKYLQMLQDFKGPFPSHDAYYQPCPHSEASSGADTSISHTGDSSTSGHPRGFATTYAGVNGSESSSFFDHDKFDIPWGKKSAYAVDYSRLLGEGSFGKVYYAQSREGDPAVAKILKAGIDLAVLRKELHMQFAVNNLPNVMKTFGAAKGKKGTYILVSEYGRSPSYLESFPEFDIIDAKWYLYNLVVGLDALHSRGVIHRDLKADNVLYDPETGKLKIIDFGLSAFYRKGVPFKSYPGSNPWKAPEILMLYPYYDFSYDVWSWGVMMAGLIFRRAQHKFKFFVSPPVKGASVRYRYGNNVMVHIVETLGRNDFSKWLNKYNTSPYKVHPRQRRAILHEVRRAKFAQGARLEWRSLVTPYNEGMASDSAFDLLDRVLVYDHEKRITAKQVVAHPFFDEVRGKMYARLRLSLSSSDNDDHDPDNDSDSDSGADTAPTASTATTATETHSAVPEDSSNKGGSHSHSSDSRGDSGSDSKSSGSE